MKSAWKRILSSFLALLMLLSVVPVETFAESGDPAYEIMQESETEPTSEQSADPMAQQKTEPETEQLTMPETEQPSETETEQSAEPEAEQPTEPEAEQSTETEANELTETEDEPENPTEDAVEEQADSLPVFTATRISAPESVPLYALTKQGLGEESIGSVETQSAYLFACTAEFVGEACGASSVLLTLTADRILEDGALGVAFFDGLAWKGFWLPAGERYELFGLLGTSYTCTQLCAALPSFSVALFTVESDMAFSVSLSLRLAAEEGEALELAACACTIEQESEKPTAYNISESVALGVSESLSITQDQTISAEAAAEAVYALMDNTAVSELETVGFAAAVEPNAEEVASSLLSAAEERELDEPEMRQIFGSIQIKLKSAEVAPVSYENGEATVTTMTFDVTPYLAVETDSGTVEAELRNELIAAPLSFRLPVSANTLAETASVYHDGVFIGFYDIKTEAGEKFVEISASSFSEYRVVNNDENTARTISVISRVENLSSAGARLKAGEKDVTYYDGDMITVIAYPRREYRFLGWYKAEDTTFSEKLSSRQEYTFEVNGDLDLAALYEPNNGQLFTLVVRASKFKINGGIQQTATSTISLNAGETIFLEFVDTSKQFLYWINASGNILSTDPVYSFTLTGDMVVESHYVNTAISASSANVIFRNAFQQVISSRTYANGEAVQFPSYIPNKMGSVFKGWKIADEDGNPTDIDATDANIWALMEQTNLVLIVPDYTTIEQTVTVTVSYTNGSIKLREDTVKSAAVGETINVAAPRIDGLYFQYWRENGVIVAYDKVYSVLRAEEASVVLEAVYGDTEIQQEPTVRITQTYAKESGGKYIISNTMEYYTPDTYEVVEAGFVYGTKASLFGADGGEDALILGAPSYVYQHISGFTVNRAIYTFNGSLIYPTITLYIRAYIIYKNADGIQEIKYSDMHSASYNSITNTGTGIVSINFDDDETSSDIVLSVAQSEHSVLDATASVPAGTKVADESIVNNTVTLTIEITDDSPANITLEAGDQEKAYDVSIHGVAADNTSEIVVYLKAALPTGLTNVKAYHDGIEMTMGSSPDSLALDQFWYDAASGDVTICVTHFSNYTFVYQVIYPITYENLGGAGNPNPSIYTAGLAMPLQPAVRSGFSFDGWYLNDQKVNSISAEQSGPVTLTAAWASAAQATFTVTWKNDDGTVLAVNENLLAGETPVYTGAEPTKAADAQYTYTFSGWTPEIASVTGDATYTATYSRTINQYTITFVNEYGTELQSGSVAYGETPVYTGAEPIKAEDAQYTYTFSGWTPEIMAVSGNKTYTATFTGNMIVTASGFSGVYDGAVHSIDVSAPEGATVTYSTDGESYTSAKPSYTDAGSYTVYYKVEKANYTTVTGSETVAIGKAALTVTANAKTITYGDAPANDGVSYSGFVSGEDENVLTGTLAYAYSYTQYGDVGEYTITPSGLTSSNYEITFNDGTLTVGAKEVGLTWGTTTFTYDGSSHVPTATATGLVGTDTCTVTVSGEQTNVGSYTATATGLSNGNYKLPSANTQSFTIVPATMNVTASGYSGSYDANAHSITVSVTAPEGATVTYSTDGESYTSAKPSYTDAGSYTVYYKVEKANYTTVTGSETVAIGKAALTVTANAKTITYGDAPANDGVSYSGFVSGEDENVLTGTLAYAYSYTQYGDVGEYTITPSGQTSGNYDITYETGVLTVGAKEVGLIWGTTSFTYDGSSHVPTAEATGTVNGDTCTVTVSGAQSNAGSYTATAASLSNGNYKLPSANTQSFTIVPATMNVTASGYSGSYDANAHSITVSVTAPEGATVTYSTDGESYTSAKPSYTDAGSYTVYYKVEKANYTTVTGSETVAIGKAALTVTANAKTITYGDAPANDGVSYSGFVSGEDENVLTGTLAYAYSYTQYGDVGEYTITPSGLTSGNYEITFNNGTLTVGAKEVGLTWGTTSFTYDGNSHVPTATATGLVGTDTCDVTVSGEQTNVGSYTATAASLSNDNYKLPSANTQSFTIVPATMAISVNGSSDSKVYNGAEQSYEGTVTATSEATSFDASKFSYSGNKVASGTNAGIYTTALDESKCSYADANYTVTWTIGTPVTLTITAKPVTITVNNASKTYGETDHAFTGTVTGLVNNSDLGTVTYSRTGNDENVGTYTGVLTASYTANGNYSVTVTPGDFTINPKAVTVTADAKSKTYGEADPTLTATVTGTVGTDTVTYTVTRASGDDAGTYTITPSGAATQGNYSVTYKTGTFTINKADPTYTAPTAKSLTYDGSAQALVNAGTASGGEMQYSLSESSGYSTTIPTGKNAGDYTVWYKVVGDSNHNNVAAASVDVTIARKDATVTVVENQSKIYGNADPESFATNVSGLVENETINYSVSRVAGENVGDYTISVTLGENPNYNVTATNGTLTISQRPITVKAKNQTVMLPDTITTTGDVFTLTSGMLVDGQTATVTVTTTESEVGVYEDGITVEVVTITEDETDVTANYAITTVPGGLTIEATASYTVTYMVDEVQSGEDDTVAYGTEVTLREVPTKTGYTAVWTTEDAEIDGDGFRMPQKGVTLTAEWTANEFTVSFNANSNDYSADLPESLTFTYDSAAEDELPVLSMEGYAFSGWCTVAEPQENDESISYAADTLSTALTAEQVNALYAKASGEVGSQTVTLHAQWTKLNSFTHSENFSNASYIYRVGNANTVKLGALFAVDEAGNQDVVSNDVTITVTPHVDSSVGDEPTYSKNASDWTQSTLRFTGTGPITITIQEGETGAPYTMDLEIVAAKNVTAYSELSNTSCVLLNDITMSSGGKYYLSGATLYGNGFEFDVRDAAYAGTGYETSNYVVFLSSGKLDNVRIIGKVYTQYGGTAGADYNYPCVYVNGTSEIANSYISNCASAVRVSAGNLLISNTTLKGGCLANLEVRSGGHVTVDGLTTINQVANNDSADNGTVIVGLGILFYYEGLSGNETLIIRGNGLTQYNSVADNQKGNAVSISQSIFSMNPIETIFNNTDSKYIYTDSNGTKWVNTGILSLEESVGSNNITTPSGYEWTTVSMLGKNGNLCTKTASAQVTSSDYSSTAQYAIAPSFSFEYPTASGKKNYVAKTEGSNDYCFWDSSTSSVSIGFTEGESASFDPNILTVTKNSKNIIPTVSFDNGEYQAVTSNITISSGGDHTLTYKYVDPYNYKYVNGTVTAYDMTYYKVVEITAVAAKPGIKPAEFSFGSNGSRTVLGSDGVTYVMPDVNARDYSTTSATIYSTTKGGQTIYYPVVFVSVNNNMTQTDITSNRVKSETTTVYCPVFKGVVSITDYDENNNPTTYGTGTTTLADGKLSYVESGLKTALNWSNSGTQDVTTKVQSNNIYFVSKDTQGVNRNQATYDIEYIYTDTAGNVYHYFVRYVFPSKGSGVQMVGYEGAKYTVTFAADTGGSVSVTGNNGTVSGNKVTYNRGTDIQSSGNTVYYGKASNNKVIATATAEDGYSFSSWDGVPSKFLADNITITAIFSSGSGGGGSSSCFSADTLITLADGTQKIVKDISIGDMVLTFDHSSGAVVASKVVYVLDLWGSVDSIFLTFSDSSTLELLNMGHGLYDTTLQKYVLITADNVVDYVGHGFLKYEGDSGVCVRYLVDYTVSRKDVERFDIMTENTNNAFINGYLGVPDTMVGASNVFDFTDSHTYDYEKLASDIETYGLYEYEEWAEYLTEEEFEIFGGAYFKIAVEKGYITEEEIIAIINDFHGGWMTE